MCEYCDPSMNDDYWSGKDFELLEVIDGSNQEFEICIQDNPELEQKVINLNGTTSRANILINYCPMCGIKL